MKSYALAAIALLIAVSSAALADDGTIKATVPACDYFENALIGSRCAGTMAVGAGLSQEMLRTQAEQPSYSFVSTSERLNALGYVSVSPATWLTLGLSSSVTDYDSSFHFQPKPGSAINGRYSTTFVDSQTFSASVNLIDTGPAASHYIVNLFGGDSLVPAHDNLRSNNRVFGGFSVAGKWQLGQSGYSLSGRSSQEAAFNTDTDFTILYPAASILLSNDAWGIAVGPRFQSAHIVSGGNPRFPTDAYFAGAEIIAQPFRGASNWHWDGLVMNATVMQSIGQAGFVSNTFDARDTIVGGSIRYNFKY